MSTKEKQLNIRTDDELLAEIDEVQNIINNNLSINASKSIIVESALKEGLKIMKQKAENANGTQSNKIIVDVWSPKLEGLRKVAFVGKWILENLWLDNNGEYSASIAITKEGQYFYYHTGNREEDYTYKLYTSFENMKKDSKTIPKEIILAIPEHFSKEIVELLDI